MSIRDRLLEPEGLFRTALFRDLLRTHFDTDNLKAGDRAGAYRIVRELGRGGMGVVYLAERADGEFEQIVALKWLPETTLAAESAALFRRERQYLAELSHPNIARLIDGGRTEAGHLWFAMECIEGLPIDQHAVVHALDERARAALMIPVVEAIEFAHSRLLIHRDIKPGNVLIDPEGRPRLLDFGIAGIAQESDQTLAFTPEYASPEQRTLQSVGTASDVWQLGKLLESVLSNGRTKPLPRDLRAIIDKATADSPAERYSTATALKDDLRRFLAYKPIRARRNRAAYRLKRLAQRHPWSASGTVFGALAVSSLIAGFLWYAADERDRLRQARDETAAINSFLSQDVFGANDPFYGSTSNASLPDVLESSLKKVDKRFGKHPAIAGEIDRTLGDALLSRGRYDAALRAADSAVRRLSMAHGPVSPEAGRARLLRALVDTHLGKSEQARRLLQQLRADFPLSEKKTFQLSWEIESALGWNAVQLSKFTECKDIFTSLLSNMQGIDVVNQSDVLHSLSLCQSMLGEFTVALKTAQKAETLGIKSSSEESALTSLARIRQSTAMSGLGKHGEAIRIMQHEVENLTRLLGPEHNTSLTYTSHLGVAHLCADETTQASDWLGRASEGRNRTLGAEHPWTIISESQYAVTLLRDGDSDAASPVFKSLESRLPRIEEPLARAWALRALGEWSLRQDHSEKAISYFSGAHTIASQPDMRFRAGLYEVESGLALSLAQAGRDSEAAAVFKRLNTDRSYATQCTNALMRDAQTAYQSSLETEGNSLQASLHRAD